MSKRSSRRNQKLYKMRGCSKKSRKNYLGGSGDAPLAYTGKQTPSQSNPFLAYTGKGGSSCSLATNTNFPTNTNASNPAYPNTGPVPTGNIIYNSSAPMRGGSCGCGLNGMNGGASSLTSMGFMVGGVKHRSGCKCSKCKKMRNANKRGGNAGIPYPNGLVGSPWTPSEQGWPGVNGIPGDSNYIPPNQYKVDPQTALVDVLPNSPILTGGNKRKQKGGTLSNFMTQDLINLGRQFQFGLGSAYNALAGYAAPVNPLPWKGQFPSGGPLYPVRPSV